MQAKAYESLEGTHDEKTQKFIDIANKVHSGKYSYSNAIYKKAKLKLLVTCKEHGDFEVSPDNHKRGRGCPKCRYISVSEKKKKAPKDLISDFVAVHGEKYIYPEPKARYGTKVEIICKEHGEFLQDVTAHRSGQGCPKCGLNKPLRITHEKFITHCVNVHNNFYDYSQTEYTGIKNYLTIVCPIHGQFAQTAELHYLGKGCRKCSTERNSENRKRSRADLLEAFRKVHGEEYSYEFAKIDGSSKKIAISCKLHGIFMQTPTKHLSGQKCPKCSIGSPYRRSLYVQQCDKYSDGKSNLYVVEMSFNDEKFLKVGITNTDVKTRYHGNCKPIYHIEEQHFIKGEAGFIWDLEKKLHRMLKEFHVEPAHPFGGSKTECFSRLTEQVEEILLKYSGT
ncbi:hypothetical protein RFH95_11305 [Acinetobacter nosocomialis]|uniref:hypothetical protein n=1 Tax=Acinetobacter nosocomialis TaxID=106654 RepID=UPI0028104F08|nr:hypothetical protein [Acinetobacter nosocomialis]MDQ9041011.1 hypothetical protein [Acinetobacter nosocomialis]